MYLDQTSNHARFAAYEISVTDLPNAAGAVQDVANYYERYFGLQERELEARMSAASRSSSNQRAAINQQAKAEKARLALATRQLEEIGIPELQLKQWVAAKNTEIAQAATRLDYINTYLQAKQSPDMYWYAQGYRDTVNKLGGLPWEQSQVGVETPQQSAPQPQSLATLVADLTGGGSGQTAQTVQQATGGDQSAPGGGGANPQGDPRLSASLATLMASPPSPGEGLNAQDQQALKTIGALYQSGLSNLPLNALEGQSPGFLGYFTGAGKQLGYLPQEELYKYGMSRWGQGSPTAA